MKTFLKYAAWSLVATLILVALLDPKNGLLYQSPMTCVSLGVIGLGLCLEVRQRITRPTPAKAPA